MSMIKVIPPGSYDFGEKTAQLIKIASSGLRGNDLGALIKRAGHEFADSIKNMTFDKGEVPIHLIALGATEAVGPNRNGDGFKVASCRKYHDTFVKNARWYRNHANKNKAKSYGIVKSSSYNEVMKRIELVVALNATKEAAERNKGLVADEEITKLEKGDDLGVSMACKVAYDTCSGCGHRAKNRTEYCTSIEEGGTCKYGGLKHNIGIVLEDGHQLHADNPHPMFFDISKVFRPADRTAFVLGKVASSEIVGGAELAEILGVSAPIDLSDDYGFADFEQIKLARTLADREQNYQNSAYDKALTTYREIDNLENFSQYQRQAALRALVNEKIALSLSDWLRLTTGESEEKLASITEEVKQYLPSVFSSLVEDVNLSELLGNNPYRAGVTDTPDARNWASKYAEDCSLDNSVMQKRIWRTALEQRDFPSVRVKSASVSSRAANELAKQYGVYQIGFLQDLGANAEIDLTSELLIRQNRVQ